MEVILTAYDYLYKRLSMPKFFTSQWLRVGAFVNAIDRMNMEGVHIDDETAIEVMKQILDRAGDAETLNEVSVNTLKRGYDLLLKSYETKQMDDSWFVSKFGQIYQQVIALRKNEDFVINPKRMDQFLDLVSFFLHNVDEDGKVEIEKTEPRHGFGGVTAKFIVLTLRNENVLEFCKVLKNCSAVSIDSCDDGACISCTVPDVFVRNPK